MATHDAGIGPIQDDAARSVDVLFGNQTEQTLQRKSFGLSHGKWSGDSVPPELIAGGTTAYWRSQSDGLATGTEGFAEYFIGTDPSAVISVKWDNPFSGSNKYDHTQPAGYTITVEGGSGDNATVTFILKTA